MKQTRAYPSLYFQMKFSRIFENERNINIGTVNGWITQSVVTGDVMLRV